MPDYARPERETDPMYTYKATTVRPSSRMKFARRNRAGRLKAHLISAAVAALVVVVWYGAGSFLSF